MRTHTLIFLLGGLLGIGAHGELSARTFQREGTNFGPSEQLNAVTDFVHQRDNGRLIQFVRGLTVSDEPTTVPLDSDGTIPKPTLVCDLCRTLSGFAFDYFNVNATSSRVHDLKEFVNRTCARWTKEKRSSDSKTVDTDKDKKLDALCDDIGDALVDLGTKLDYLFVSRFHFNMSVTFCSSILPLCKVPCCTTETKPEQIHIGFPTDGDAVAQGQMQATWATYDKPQHPQLIFWPTGNHSATITIPAATTTYTVSGWKGWLHGAVMTGLLPNTEYSYQVGDGKHSSAHDAPLYWSAVLNFTTFPSNIGTPERPLRLVSFADMGTGGTHTETVDAVMQLIQEGKVDMIVHGGDISYADGDSYRWDRFLRQMQPLVSRVPYMCIPGNHELLFNFSAYRTRFWMQPRANHGAPNDAMFYTFSVGPHIRFLMMDSEDELNTPAIGSVQTSWADRVLQEASAAKQFIFAAFHRPLYCTSGGDGEDHNCNSGPDGYLTYMQNQVEDMFIANNVALVHTGHIHNYERTFPVAHGVRQSTSYENATYPISFVNGAPGCEEGLSGFGVWRTEPRPNWSAKRIEKTSFMFSEIHSELQAGDFPRVKHTAHIKQHSSRDLSVLDEITLTKTL